MKEYYCSEDELPTCLKTIKKHDKEAIKMSLKFYFEKYCELRKIDYSIDKMQKFLQYEKFIENFRDVCQKTPITYGQYSEHVYFGTYCLSVSVGSGLDLMLLYQSITLRCPPLTAYLSNQEEVWRASANNGSGIDIFKEVYKYFGSEKEVPKQKTLFDFL